MPTPWTQTPKEVVIELPLPAGAKAKDVKYTLTSKSVKLVVLGQELLSGEFFHPEHWMVMRKPNLLPVYPNNGISGNPFKLQAQG